MNKPPQPVDEKPKVVWAKKEGSSDESIDYDPGRPYCCGLIHTGDSLCKNFCKVFIICVVCPLVIYWCWKSGAAEEIYDNLSEHIGGACECCKKCNTVVEENLNGGCIDSLCNTDSCKHCCGITTCLGGFFSCLGGMCNKNCFSDICKFFGECGGGCGECFGRIKDLCGQCCHIESITKCCKGTFTCDFKDLACCDIEKGLKNPLQCFGKCPCCKKLGEMDTCSICEKAKTTVSKGAHEAEECCGGCHKRICNCCYGATNYAKEKGVGIKSNAQKAAEWGKGKFTKTKSIDFLIIF